MAATTTAPRWLVERPIAHRGLHAAAAGRPENSLAAFAEACRRGYPIELDVQLLADGAVVVVHDRLPAGTRTADLPRLSGPGGESPPPLLDEVLARVAGRVPILIDIKDHGIDGRLETRLAETLAGYRGEVALSSFNPVTLLHLRRLGVKRPLGQISGLLRSAHPALLRVMGRSLFSNLLTRPDFLSYELAGLPSRAASRWRRRGLPLIVWTVTSPEKERVALGHGDNFIFSGYEPQGGQAGA